MSVLNMCLCVVCFAGGLLCGAVYSVFVFVFVVVRLRLCLF